MPNNPSLQKQVATLPLVPGVYLFKDAEGKVLYVGKANRLRERVRSYFANDIAATRNPGIEQMVNEAIEIAHEAVGSEPEALLLEARLIRRHKPKYNILLRDDKSFLLVKIDLALPFPTVTIAREKDLEDLLIRKKRELPREHRISQRLQNAEYYGPFPSAYAVKGVLNTIRRIWPYRDCSPQKFNQFAKLGHGCLFASLGLCEAPCAAKVTALEYRRNIDQIRKFLKGEQGGLIEEVEQQMAVASENERYEEAAMLRDRLFALQRFRYVVDTFRVSKPRGNRSEVVGGYDPERDIRMECYDISNNQGEFAVGSSVCGILKDGKVDPVKTAEQARARFSLDKSRYKKFKIRTVVGISDVEMLQEVLTRRFNRGKRSSGAGEPWALPDLVLIDGGKAQLGVVLKVRAAVFGDDTARVRVGSVAKGPTRKRTDLYGTDWNYFPLVENEGWHLVAELLREEAHRFAIGYYRNLHRKGVFGS